MKNTIKLVGRIVKIEDDNPTAKNHHLLVSVKRHSGTEDIIPVSINKKAFYKGHPFSVGNTVHIEGLVCSSNTKDSNGKSHLNLYVSTRKIQIVHDEEDMNEVELEGVIVTQLGIRTTPKTNRYICDIILANNAEPMNRAAYLPCIAFGLTAQVLSQHKVKDEISFKGRFQSREYIKKLEDGESITKTAYEMCINYLYAQPKDDTNGKEEAK